jgi:hypothetical protein
MADGLWQRVRLILDRTSADEVKSESQKALKEGTDPKAAERNLDRVESRTDRLRKTFVRLGAAIVAAFAVRAVGRFLRESLQAGEQLRSSRVRVQQALRNEGIQWEAVEGQVRGYTRALWESHRLTEGEVNPSLQALLVITGDYELSLRGVGIAADLAAAANMDVQSAARLVGRVMNGETTALRRYGITIEEGADAVQVLEERLAGMAKAATPPTVVLTKAWGDLKEAVGEVLIVGGETDSMLGGITDRIRGLTDDINANQERIGRWVSGVASGFATVGRAVGFVLNGIRMAVEAIGAMFGSLSVQVPIVVRGMMLEVESAILTTVERMMTPLRFLGVTVGEEFMDGAIAGVRSRREVLRRELRAAQMAFHDTLADIGTPLRGAGGGGAPSAPGGAGGGLLGSGGGAAGVSGLEVPEPQLREIGMDWATAIQGGFEILPEQMKSILERATEEVDRFDHRFHQTARGLERGFEPFFSALYTGFGDTAQLMDGFVASVQGVGAAVVGALAQGQVEYHRAQGIAKLAEGMWPPNPAAIASSLQHFAAAAAFAALPGLVGGRGGGASGSLGGIRSADTPRAPGPGNMGGPDINIYLDGVDESNPRHQRVVGEASRKWSERTGGSIQWRRGRPG